LTGTIPFGANVFDPDELNASAVAVALTLFVLRDQMREKNVGRPGKTSSDDLYLHLRIHPEGIRSSKSAIRHGRPVVLEIHVYSKLQPRFLPRFDLPAPGPPV
jgi:hypothetical protein